MPSLKDYFTKMDMNSKESFNAYLRKNLNKDSSIIYEQVYEIIRQVNCFFIFFMFFKVFETQNYNMKTALNKFKNKRFILKLTKLSQSLSELYLSTDLH